MSQARVDLRPVGGSQVIERTEKSHAARGRLVRLAAGGAALALLLAACGGSETEAPAAPVETPATSGDAPDAAEPEIDLSAAEAFYRGKTITWVIPYAPGGGHDAYGRAFAPFLAEELGANVVFSNEPGAGAMLATNRWANEPNPDGLTISNIPTTGVLLNLLTEAESIAFERDAIAWLGVLVNEPPAISVSLDGPFATWDDVLAADRPLRYGLTGFGNSTHFTLALVNDIFELGMDYVTGYGSSAEMALSMVAGDIDMLGGSIGSAVSRFNAGESVPVLIFERPERFDPSWPENLASIFDYVEDPALLDVITAHAAVFSTARGVVTSSRVPEDRLLYLEQAVERALNNPEFAAVMAASGSALNVQNGEWFRSEVDLVLDSPPQYKDFLMELLTQFAS